LTPKRILLDSQSQNSNFEIQTIQKRLNPKSEARNPKQTKAEQVTQLERLGRLVIVTIRATISSGLIVKE
jgi:hypothetical protein